MTHTSRIAVCKQFKEAQPLKRPLRLLSDTYDEFARKNQEATFTSGENNYFESYILLNRFFGVWELPKSIPNIAQNSCKHRQAKFERRFLTSQRYCFMKFH